MDDAIFAHLYHHSKLNHSQTLYYFPNQTHMQNITARYFFLAIFQNLNHN